MKKLLLFTLLFPIIIFSQTQIGQDINGEAADDLSGSSLALSADGKIVAIGARANDGNGTNSGQVRVYENIGGVWTQIGKDIDGETSSDLSGSSLSLSADGKIVAIGAPQNSGNGSSSGHVRVYENITGVWTQIGADIDGEDSGDISGASISLSSDGKIVAIGAHLNDDNGSSSGHVRVFENIGGVWTQIGFDIEGNMSDNFGLDVSLSGDGKTVAASTPFGGSLSDFISDYGAVRIFENIGGTWAQIGADIESDQADDTERTTALSYDGSILAIGAIYNDNEGRADKGQIRVYENNGGVWTQLGSDINGEGGGDNSGIGLALSSDGKIIAIGAPQNKANGFGTISTGHCRVYQYIGGDWTQIGIDIDGDENSNFGFRVSLSSDGMTLAVGAPTANANNSGMVRIYDLSVSLSTSSYLRNNLNLYPNPTHAKTTINLINGLVFNYATIYTYLGQEIMTVTQPEIDVSDLAKGVYLIEVSTDTGKGVKKFIKN